MLLKLKINIYKLINNSIRRVYYLFCYNKLSPKIDYKKVNNVMFVAHPDDEFIFLGNRLINEDNWLVICMTNGDNIRRSREFISLMKDLNLQYKILNFKDGQTILWDEKKVKNLIHNILINKRNWDTIATHNSEGEYGHYQHKQLNQIVKSISKTNIKVFSHESTLKLKEKKLSDVNKERKLNYAKEFYKSQLHVINDINMQKYFDYEGIVDE